MRTLDPLDAHGRRRQNLGARRRRHRQHRTGGNGSGLDRWCIFERPTQRQRRIGKMERRIRGYAVQRSMGSLTPISQGGRTVETFAAIRRLIIAAFTLLVESISGGHSYAQSGPFTGLAGNWSGGGTVTLDDG